MKRSPLTRRTPLRSKPKATPKPERQRAMLAPVPAAQRPRAVMALCVGVAEAQPKTAVHRDQRIRDSARGEACMIRLPGCQGGTERTIWSHYRGSAGGKGMGLKASDICGCYGCTYCDAIYDGQAPRPDGLTFEQVELAWHRAHIRSLGRLHAKGFL